MFSIVDHDGPQRQRPSLATTFSAADLGREVTEAETAWLRGFWLTQRRNYAGRFHMVDKGNVDRILCVLVTVFHSDRSPIVGAPWTWSLQVIEGPRKMIMERPGYSDLYFKNPLVAALDILEDLDEAGFVPGQPRESAVAGLLRAKRAEAEAEEVTVTRQNTRLRVVDTD
jgi:hypothetical protein